ncbi:MAG: hypothetical protein LBP93_08730 [Treponema sp.]|jgi:hypothetical protein|nr:hypothetical protein [Treponema sp.]
MNYPIRPFLKIPPWFFVLAVLSCSKAPPSGGSVPQGGPASPLGIPPLAIIQAGEFPLWFELGAEGPAQIPSPAEASLSPFAPWPLSRHVGGLLLREQRLIAGVNREGFLVSIPWEGDAGPERHAGRIALYRISDPYWNDYSLDTLFFVEGKAAALLYRDDFFVEPPETAPSPRVMALEKGKPRPEGLEVPAFSGLPAAEGWDVENLRRGGDGLWYYRGVKKGGSEPEIVYLRTPDLMLPGEASSAGALRRAVQAAPLAEAPAALQLVLERGFSLPSGNTRGGQISKTAAVLSPGYSGPRYFAENPAAAGEDMLEFFAYYADMDAAGTDATGMDAEEPGAEGPYALLISPEGRGVYGKLRDGVPETGEFSLPALPEGFVYTGIGLCASVLFVPWEEREDWKVGAAGFLIITAP